MIKLTGYKDQISVRCEKRGSQLMAHPSPLSALTSAGGTCSGLCWSGAERDEASLMLLLVGKVRS